MKTRATRAFLVLTVAFAASLPQGCGGTTTEAPRFVPARALWPETVSLGDGDQAIRVEFDKPMVEASEVGVGLAAPPLTVDPAARLAAMWDDRQTLVIEPAEELAPSTTYTVRLAGELAAHVDAADAEFSFVYKPLEVVGTFGFEAESLPPLPRLGLKLNQDVAAADLELFCAIESADGSSRIPVVAPSAELVGAEMVLAPSRPLEQGASYTLACDGLAGAGGDTPMSAPYELDLATYAAFAVAGFAPEGDDVWSDEVEIRIGFATPVSADALRAHLESQPAIAGLERGSLDASGTEFRAIVDLESETAYAFRLRGDLADVYGQKLGEDRRFAFRTGVARPRLEMETGIFAVEALNRNGAYPVWTRNLKKFDVDCAMVPERAIVGLLTGTMNYDAWYDAGTDGPLDWKALKLAHRKSSVRAAGEVDAWRLKDLDLKNLCGGSGARGVYLAEITSAELEERGDDSWRDAGRKRVLANVTDLGVLLKVGSSSGLLWVTRFSDGAPQPGATVKVYSPQGKKVFTGTTDKDGLVRFPGADELLDDGAANGADADGESYEEYDTWRSRRLIATVQSGRDLAVIDGNWANGIQIWNFGVEADYRGAGTRYRGFLMTDRGVYRPGEKVHVKGLVRTVELQHEPSVPAGKRMAIHVEDSRGEAVLDRTIALSEFGGFTFDLPLSGEASLGDYYVRASIDDQTFTETFYVEEFKKVSYEVKLETPERHTRLGKPLRVAAEASYLFGAPVSGAEIQWSVMRRPHYLEFEGLSDYTFRDDAAEGYGTWWWDRYDNESYSFVADGSGTTDAHGRLAFDVSDAETGLSGPEDYVVQVTAEDPTGESVTERTSVTAHKSAAYVGLHAEECVQAVGMPFAIHAVAVTPDGARIAQKATLKYVRERQRCSYQGTWRSYPECETEHEVIWSRPIDIPANGAAIERIMPEEPGEYAVRIEAKDARGNDIAASSLVWVLGKGEAFWSGDESVRMSLIPSKAGYAPGEVARLAPRSSIGRAAALLTVERNGVLEASVRMLDSAGQGVEVPILPAYAPNVYATLSVVKGRTGEGDRERPRFQMGVAELKVSTDHARLAIAVETERPKYEPGQKVRGVVRVTSGGKPVRSEVTISVADEGVLKLIAFKTPDPMAAFYAPWGLGVDDAANLNRISRLNDPRTRDPDEGGDSGGGSSGARMRFVSSAFFEGALVTDAGGEAAFEFTAPDDLTAFRIMAVAADAGAKFGSGDSRIQIAKPLMLRPLVPRFLTSGDRLEVGVEVRNATGAKGEATVTVRATGCDLAATEKKVALADGEARTLRFEARVRDAAKAGFSFRGRLGAFGDAVAVSMPVERPLVHDEAVLSSGPLAAGSTEIPIALPAGAVPGESDVEIVVDRAGLAELGPSLKYLVEYPYGCLEQTLSRLIPLLKVKDLAGSLGLKELEGPRLERFIDAGLKKVVRHQHEDGHFSLWPGGGTYPHLTVFALYGLSEAKRAGAAVDEPAIERGVAALRSWIDGQSKAMPTDGESGTLAMAAYVLAELGRPDTGLDARLYEKRLGLPVYGKGFLLMALAADPSAREEVETLEAEIAKGIVRSNGVAHIRETGRDLDYYMSSDVRTEAIVLAALLRADPQSPNVPLLAEGLRRGQKASGRWANTQDNLYSLVALADYARSGAEGGVAVTVRLGGKLVAERALQGHEVMSVRKRLADGATGALEIAVDGPARHVVRLDAAIRDDQAKAVARGFTLTRELLEPAADTAKTRFEVGDLVRIRVTVHAPEDRSYVALVDRLPAGLEPVNTKFATSEQVYGAPPSDEDYWKPGWTHQELRDDRVLAFADRMDAGDLVLEYFARAGTPGSFSAPPATVEAMYEPDVNARTAAYAIEVAK
jgi:alpha-2-macroglobulin